MLANGDGIDAMATMLDWRSKAAGNRFGGRNESSRVEQSSSLELVDATRYPCRASQLADGAKICTKRVDETMYRK